MPPPPPPPPPGPPPPPAPSGPPKLNKSDEKGRSALLTDICKGARLKSAGHLTVDKSKPLLGSEGKSPAVVGASRFCTMTPGTSNRRTSSSFGSVSSLNSELLQKISSRLPTNSSITNDNRKGFSSQGDKEYGFGSTGQCRNLENESKYFPDPENQLYGHGKSRGSNVDIPTCGKIADRKRSSMFSTSFDGGGGRLTRPDSCKQLTSCVARAESCRTKDEKSFHRSSSFLQKPILPPPPPPVVTRPAPRPEDDGGPNASSTSTVGAAAGRGGRSAGPNNLAGLFAGGMPRLRGTTPAAAPQDPPVQNGYRANPARSMVVPRPPRPSIPSMSNSTPTSPPPPPPPSAGVSRPFFNNHDNQESLTGRGANGRLSGFGMPLPPPPPSAQLSSNNRPPPPSRTASNRAPPPPPPSRGPPSTPSSFDKPKPPAPMAPKAVPPPVPKPSPGSAPPPPPPARNNVAPSRDLPPPPNRSPRPPVPPMPSYVPQKSISSSFESKHNFRSDLPSAPGNFRKTPKSYPSAAPKNSSRSNNSASRPTPPPPPM